MRIKLSEVRGHYSSNRLPWPAPESGSREAAKNAKEEAGMCGLARIYSLTPRLRGFASSREHRSPAKPSVTAGFFSGSALARGRGLLRRRLLRRHLPADASRFRKADGDGLFAALHFLSGAAALQRSVFALVHRLLDLLSGFLPVLPC